MATYGEIRLRLKKAFPSIDQELLDGWLMDRYQQILDMLDWQRLEVHGVIQSVASYADGTAAVTHGSAAIIGSGTAWAEEMTGRIIRISGRNEFYEFTYSSGTAGTLSRPYEGDTDSAAAYRIDQNVYPLPDGWALLSGVRSFVLDVELNRKSVSELQAMAPVRSLYGDPRYYALYMDEAADPPRPQIELYPIPEAVAGFPIWGVAEQGGQDPYNSSVSVLPWVRPSALIAGASADAKRHMQDYAGADREEMRFAALASEMAAQNHRSVGPERMRMDPYYTRHRARRWMR